MTFRPEALDFLRGLEANNEREWFHAHRDEHDTLLLEPARDFVEAFGALSERRGELLRHSGLFARVEHAPPPPQTHTEEFPAFCVEGYARLVPVQRWLLAFTS